MKINPVGVEAFDVVSLDIGRDCDHLRGDGVRPVADMIDRSIITRQVEMGVAIRMAALDVLTRRARGVDGWGEAA